MKLERLLGLLAILVGTDKITIQELADRFEVSRRTIFRDLDTLNRTIKTIRTLYGSKLSVIPASLQPMETLHWNVLKKFYCC